MADPTSLAVAQAALANKPIDAPTGVSAKTDAQLHEAAKQFESVFLSEMFGFMNEGLPTDGPFGGGNGEAMMRSVLNDQYAKSVVARGGIGISDTVYKELLAIQEGAHNAGAGAKGQQ
jgi:peptidoglycan hydrolase FlgJ